MGLGHLNRLFPSGFPTEYLFAFLAFPMHVTRPAHFIRLDLITRIAFPEEYKVNP
jgi:hypothetical protein